MFSQRVLVKILRERSPQQNLYRRFLAFESLGKSIHLRCICTTRIYRPLRYHKLRPVLILKMVGGAIYHLTMFKLKVFLLMHHPLVWASVCGLQMFPLQGNVCILQYNTRFCEFNEAQIETCSAKNALHSSEDPFQSCIMLDWTGTV